jgi:hypothetical protein
MSALIPPSKIEKAANALRYYNQLDALQARINRWGRSDFKCEVGGQTIGNGLVDLKEALGNWVGNKLIAVEMELSAMGVAVREPETVATDGEEADYV